MTAKELLIFKRHQLVTVNKLMGLYSEKYNKLVTTVLHYLMLMTLTLNPLRWKIW